MNIKLIVKSPDWLKDALCVLRDFGVTKQQLDALEKIVTLLLLLGLIQVEVRPSVS